MSACLHCRTGNQAGKVILEGHAWALDLGADVGIMHQGIAVSVSQSSWLISGDKLVVCPSICACLHEAKIGTGICVPTHALSRITDLESQNRKLNLVLTLTTSAVSG